MQSVASVPFKSFNLNAFKWARGVYQEGMRQRFAAVGASLCGHQYFLLPLSAPKFCLKSSYCFWYTTSDVPFPHYLRIEKQLTACLDFCGFAHISGSFILWGRGSLPLLRLLRGVIRYSPGSFSLLHPADSADYDLLLRALTQHLTSPIILFNIPLSCSDSSLNALRWQWWKPVFVSPSSPPPHHKRHSPYVSDSRQQLIRTLQSYTKETVSLVRDVKILDWQWYMPAVCVLCVHQISESHTSHCCLDLDSSSGAENSQWIILPGCAPHLPAAPAFTQHPGGVNLHSFRLTTPTWVWNVQKRCFQV